MASTSEFQSLKKISSEVDDSRIKILYTAQSVNAQSYQIKKLKWTAELYKDRCASVCTSNMRLQTGILNGQQEMSSLHIALDKVKNSKIEVKKQLLKAEEEKLEVVERKKNEEKKYEDIWVESKARYESLRHVQRLITTKNEGAHTESQIDNLLIEKKQVTEAITKKTHDCKEKDRGLVLTFAEFMTIERPNLVKTIKEVTAAIDELKNELPDLEDKTNDNSELNKANSKEKNQCTLILPRLQLDFENHNENIDKINHDELMNTKYDSSYSVHSVIFIDPTKTTKKSKSPSPYNFPTFFYNPGAGNEGNKTQNYAKKKLVNILEDIKIDNNKAQQLLLDINPDVLQPVEAIAASQDLNGTQDAQQSQINIAEIEELDLTASNADRLLKPPSQFLDKSLEPQEFQKDHVAAKLDEGNTPVPERSQDEPYKKQVTFNLSNIEENVGEDENNGEGSAEVNITNETRNSQLDVSDEGFDKMRDMIMKKHNLELSPQFVYTKNTMTPKKSEETAVTSKFFPQDNIQSESDNASDGMQSNDDQVKMGHVENVSLQNKHTIETDVVSSPKRQKLIEIKSVIAPSGFMFGVGAPMPNIDDESMNTSGLDPDYSLIGIDSDLFLSPKGNSAMPMESQEVISQDVPYFMPGLRKTGQSFFGHLGQSESKPDSSGQNQGMNAFSFNFGGEEKKCRGSIFGNFK